MLCECLREENVLLSIPSFTSLQPLSVPPTPPPRTERERERERERESVHREDSSLLEHSTAHFLERREAENHKPSPPSPSV